MTTVEFTFLVYFFITSLLLNNRLVHTPDDTILLSFLSILSYLLENK